MDPLAVAAFAACFVVLAYLGLRVPFDIYKSLGRGRGPA